MSCVSKGLDTIVCAVGLLDGAEKTGGDIGGCCRRHGAQQEEKVEYGRRADHRVFVEESMIMTTWYLNNSRGLLSLR